MAPSPLNHYAWRLKLCKAPDHDQTQLYMQYRPCRQVRCEGRACSNNSGFVHLCTVQVTGMALSPRHPYMFSCGLDKQVKCWDLEYNKVFPPLPPFVQAECAPFRRLV